MIISINGKVESGKDTVGKIIQYLSIADFKGTKSLLNADGKSITREEHFNWFLNRDTCNSIEHKWQIKKFADKLKDIVCLLINCTREQLEDHEFKNTELGEEWIQYGYAKGFIHGGKAGDVVMNYQSCDKERYEQEVRENWQTAYRNVLTPRLLLQQIGTNLFRDKLHNNIWINSLFSEYKAKGTDDNGFITNTYPDGQTMLGIPMSLTEPHLLPNWIITDMRFPNELEAIKKRDGISIRVERWKSITEECIFNDNEIELLWGNEYPFSITIVNSYKDGRFYNDKSQVIIEELVQGWREVKEEHESETALDNVKFDYIIDNNGTIEELIEKVKEILIKENII